MIVPVQKIDDQLINFMATHGRGLICLSLSEDRVKELELPLMSQNNDSRDSTHLLYLLSQKRELQQAFQPKIEL